MANSPTVAAPIQLLQEKVLLHNPKALSKLLSLMHSLKELPDTEGGYVAWVACEQALLRVRGHITRVKVRGHTTRVRVRVTLTLRVRHCLGCGLG